MIEDDDLLKKYYTIRNIFKNVNECIKYELYSELAYKFEKFSKTKIKSYGDEASDFHDKEIPEMGSNHTCLAVISLDSALKKDKNYFSQMFLKESKYIEKRKLLAILLRT